MEENEIFMYLFNMVKGKIIQSSFKAYTELVEEKDQWIESNSFITNRFWFYDEVIQPGKQQDVV